MNNYLQVDFDFNGKTELKFGERIVRTPFKVCQTMRIRDRIVVRIADELGEFREKRAKDSLELDRYIEAANTGIWCFDLSGNLKWKIAEAFPEANHEKNIADTGHRILATFVLFKYDSQKDTIVGFTSYGTETEVALVDGALIRQVWGIKY